MLKPIRLLVYCHGEETWMLLQADGRYRCERCGCYHPVVW